MSGAGGVLLSRTHRVESENIRKEVYLQHINEKNNGVLLSSQTRRVVGQTQGNLSHIKRGLIIPKVFNPQKRKWPIATQLITPLDIFYLVTWYVHLLFFNTLQETESASPQCAPSFCPVRRTKDMSLKSDWLTLL